MAYNICIYSIILLSDEYFKIWEVRNELSPITQNNRDHMFNIFKTFLVFSHCMPSALKRSLNIRLTTSNQTTLEKMEILLKNIHRSKRDHLTAFEIQLCVK